MLIDGLINRWEIERLEGPTPQALQGPSPDGNRVERQASDQCPFVVLSDVSIIQVVAGEGFEPPTLGL
jgi:hypothetical protein